MAGHPFSNMALEPSWSNKRVIPLLTISARGSTSPLNAKSCVLPQGVGRQTSFLSYSANPRNRKNDMPDFGRANVRIGRHPFGLAKGDKHQNSWLCSSLRNINRWGPPEACWRAQSGWRGIPDAFCSISPIWWQERDVELRAICPPID